MSRPIERTTASATFLVAVNGVFVFTGQQYTISGAAAVVVSLSPVLAPLFALLLLPSDRLSPTGAFGVLLGLAGVVVVQPDPGSFVGTSGFDPVSRTITTGSRASYYPGDAPITVRMVADRENGRVVGAGMVGTDRVAKRIDTVATALHAEMTVAAVESLDLAYAPPFGPVWDPVLTAAKVLRGAL